jgi:hypothetical protein
MSESALHTWWSETIIPALVERPLHRRNREVIESATVTLDGTTLVVRGGGDNVIASSALADLMTETVVLRPPPTPLEVTKLRFPEMAP